MLGQRLAFTDRLQCWKVLSLKCVILEWFRLISFSIRKLQKQVLRCDLARLHNFKAEDSN